MTASAGPALRQLHEEFGGRVRFVTVYVREAHPGERYPQPETTDRKLRHARDYRERDQIDWTIVVDDLEGKLHRALDEKPNSAYLVDPDGTVVFRSLWSNDEAVLREGLEAAAEGRRPEPAQREPRLRPMLAGIGEMYRILGLAGREARRDVRREVPPLYLIAKTADLFRPLPPRARSAAAAAVLGVGLGAAVGAAGYAWRRR